MGYADRFYYGQCKLAFENITGRVIAKSNKGEWAADASLGKATLVIPGSDQYTITANGKSQIIELGYGEYRKVDI